MPAKMQGKRAMLRSQNSRTERLAIRFYYYFTSLLMVRGKRSIFDANRTAAFSVQVRAGS